MSLLELMMERYNPGSVGSVEAEGIQRKAPSAPVVWLKFAFSVLVIGSLMFSFVYFLAPDAMCFGWVVFFFIIYLFAGLFLRPKPDMKNLGWVGGLIDNPLRYSDDLNRTLLWLLIFLYPGKFLAGSILEWVFMISSGRGS